MTFVIKRIVPYAWPQFEISLTHQISLIQLTLFCHIHGNVTFSVSYSLILASRPRCGRLCLGVGIKLTLITKRIVTYARPQIEISLTHQISLIALILFCHIQGNVTVSGTYNPNFASRPRSIRICPGVRLQTTCIIRHISEQILKFH